MRVQVFDWVKTHGGEPIIPFSGAFENKLVDMPQDEQETFCKEVRHLSVTIVRGCLTGGVANICCSAISWMCSATLAAFDVPCCDSKCTLCSQCMATTFQGHIQLDSIQAAHCVHNSLM